MFNIEIMERIAPKQDLNTYQQRTVAIQLRQSGSTIAQIKKVTGLSAPTIIALNKAFQLGGLQSVLARKKGRPSKKTQDIHLLNQAEWGGTWKELLNTSPPSLWTFEDLSHWLNKSNGKSNKISANLPLNKRSTMRLMKDWGWMPLDRPTIELNFLEEVLKKKLPAFSGSNHELPHLISGNKKYSMLFSQDRRGKLYWCFYKHPLIEINYLDFFQKMLQANPKGYGLQLQFSGLKYTPSLSEWLAKHSKLVSVKIISQSNTPEKNNSLTKQKKAALFHSKQSFSSSSISSDPEKIPMPSHHSIDATTSVKALTHLQRLEAESIHIMREVLAEADKPAMLYSIGKDSAVMLHLALKAFYPAPLPFPLLHVDTGWKFKDMYDFRDQMKDTYSLELLTHINADGLTQGINPFTHGSQIHTDVMKTQGLKQALDQYGFDVTFGGARRDEEKSRAKERIFSFRNSQHCWDPKQQRPEIWSLYNAKKNKGESIRVFPISNWTELDIWQYIYLENIPIVPLYFAKERPVVERDGSLIMVDDERMPLAPGEIPMIKRVRFRTLGCYPLTGAVESQASTLPGIIQEILLTKTSERQGRVIDHDSAASMEKKKQEGYF